MNRTVGGVTEINAMTYQVIEKFISIDGEGPTAGMLAAFIRFEGCNLRCGWCDTPYSWAADAEVAVLTEAEIVAFVKASGVARVTLTGGEPLIQPGIEALVQALLALDESLVVHIETNGSVGILALKSAVGSQRLRFIVDFKLPESGMTSKMCLDNLRWVDSRDVYKFVAASQRDLETALDVIKAHDLCDRCQVFFSPVAGRIAPADMVDFMKEHRLNKVRLQLQLHKLIWPEARRGV